MRVSIDSKEVVAFTPRMQKDLLLARAQEKVAGSVMSAADATRQYIRQTGRWFFILGAVAVVLILALTVAGALTDPIDGGLIAVAGPIVAGVLVFFLWWLLRRRIGTWNARLGHRQEGLPAIAAGLSVDATGLAVGIETFAWPGLAIEAIELSEFASNSDGQSTIIYMIERLALSAGPRAFVLDRAMLRNGPLLVDNAWRWLHRREP